MTFRARAKRKLFKCEEIHENSGNIEKKKSHSGF